MRELEVGAVEVPTVWISSWAGDPCEPRLHEPCCDATNGVNAKPEDVRLRACESVVSGGFGGTL